ncbi:replication protein A 70 kDa DNA-binding subunit B, partial [Tanacetum coccineum]
MNEGACYRISNFGIGENSENFPLLEHRFKLSFFKNTALTRIESFDNNPRGFRFEHFGAFTSRKFSERELSDVIGTIVSIYDAIPFNYAGVDKITRTVILEDYEGARLECCFFIPDKFSKLYDERDKSGIVVMILQLCKVKYFNEKPSVTLAMYSTKLYINNDIPEIVAFRKRYSEKEGFDPENHSIVQFTSVKKEVTVEDFFRGGVKTMVGHIRDSGS